MIETQEAQKAIRAWAITKGWRDDHGPTRTFGDDIALCHSELSEALEAFRDHAVDDHFYIMKALRLKEFNVLTEEEQRAVEKFSAWSYRQHNLDSSLNDERKPPEMTDADWKLLVKAGVAKPEGVGSELADTAIRLLDMCEEYGLDLGQLIREKMMYNETRAYRHGGRAL